MRNIDSLWFEVAVVSFIFALGNILFGHFEERTPKWRRVAKFFVFLILILLLSAFLGRVVAFSFLAFFLIPLIIIHGFYLPSKGINGFTGEPKAKYYEFRKWDKNIF